MGVFLSGVADKIGRDLRMKTMGSSVSSLPTDAERLRCFCEISELTTPLFVQVNVSGAKGVSRS
jgi:hypothetical protein